jgi:GTP pyrophosphokinase
LQTPPTAPAGRCIFIVETTTSSAHRVSGRLLEAGGRLAARLPPGEVPTEVLARASAIASMVESLGTDEDLVLGALAFPVLDAQLIEPDELTQALGPSAARFAADLGHMGRFSTSARWEPARGLSASQAETLRKMLLAIVTDPRLVVVRLAEQLHLMRSAKAAPADEQRRLALETRELYAPLANRLGVWQLKWELEDLAFRYLEPDEYRKIAAALGSRRLDRERYLEAVKAELQAELAKAGIEAEVEARPKHIFSIWRKMQRKQLTFEQVFDVRAVRVLVATVADCYAALGVVHGLWPYIPGEFDDYIATPKENGYRSIHTAVTGPAGQALEVQIRTREMHAQAELGIGSHWRYKEGGPRDAAYEQKIDRLRQLLEPQPLPGADQDLIDRARAGIFEDRVYVLSPKGEVVELPKDATPLDFAYHVHTDLGHRCRGARVDGRIVQLDHRLKNGELVEIVAGKTSQPSRDWLSERLGFLASPRSRAKVRAWFRKHDEQRHRDDGRAILERELGRLGVKETMLADVLADFGCESVEELQAALGSGGVTPAQVGGALQRRQRELGPVRREPPKGRPSAQTRGVVIEGIDDVLCNFSRCCRPVPPESIVGYITHGRGVSIHRSDCRNLARLRERQPERLIAVNWGAGQERQFSVNLTIRAWDRRGLVRDVSAVLADEKINIQRMTTVTNEREGTADIDLGIGVHGLEELARILARISALPNVLSARRR